MEGGGQTVKLDVLVKNGIDVKVEKKGTQEPEKSSFQRIAVCMNRCL